MCCKTADYCEVLKLPLTSVVLTTRNEAKMIERCIISLFEQNYSNFEIIVVDAESTDGTSDVLQKLIPLSIKYPNCKRYDFLRTKAPTPAKGRNIGVAHSNGEIIAFTDADCVADKNWLFTLVSNIGDDIGLVAGPNIIQHIKPSKKSDIIDRVLKTFIASAGSLQFSTVSKITLVSGAVPACNMALRKELLQQLGGFDESLRFNEDTDLCQRIRQNGYRILYTPYAKVLHYMGIDSISQFFRFIWKYGSERGNNIPRHPKLFSKFFAMSVSIFVLLIALTINAFFFPYLMMPVLMVLLLSLVPIVVTAIRIGLCMKSKLATITSIYIFLILFMTYNSALLYGVIKGSYNVTINRRNSDV